MNFKIANSCVCCGEKNLNKSPAILMPFISERVFDWTPVEINEDWGLRTVKSGMAYSICNSLQCTNCHHLFLDIRFGNIEMDRLYHEYRKEEYVELREKYEPGYKLKNSELSEGYNYISDIEKFIQPHLIAKQLRILDWGGDSGKNTPFKSSCDSIDIYDISNVKVIGNVTMVNKDELSKKNYDLIICSNVLEHIPFPKCFLDEIKSIMDKDTILYIELPNEDIVREARDLSELYRLKKHWHEHINFFNENSIINLLKSLNLDLIDLNSLAVSNETAGEVFQVLVKINNN